ncbi:hypothetical protein GOP47_0003378 [Adiantum capillus-veneris]|uniref:J domain-containing protein n=1 Tax=Adiantum capillus-veneris TaxID=13818 RepID=A0A9D4ZSH2_ADICA|nr:hypothetical protein GOP47_0003378 [Adiantum capillus-veneris]
MRISDARDLLGVSDDASLSQLKEAYKQKALEKHPDHQPPSLKQHAEAEFQQIAEAYSCLKAAKASGLSTREEARNSGHSFARRGSRLQFSAPAVPFLFIIFGTVGLGVAQARRAYRESQKQASSHNPFLP